jgi:MarR family transcriptional regulator, organic hydroperoxide resistance regulator
MPSPDALSDATYPLDPVLDFLRLLWSIEHGLQRMSKRMEGELGITGPQRLVLGLVGRFPGLSAGQLAHIVRLHPSTITGILQRLVARGLIERERDPADSRRAQLRLKVRARRYTRISPGTVEKAVTQALEPRWCGERPCRAPSARGSCAETERVLSGIDKRRVPVTSWPNGAQADRLFRVR